jgi:hypothetical protein
MTLFTNYRKRIVKRISELENEQADLVLERSKHNLHLQPKEYCSFSMKLDSLKKIIDELKRLLC